MHRKGRYFVDSIQFKLRYPKEIIILYPYIVCKIWSLRIALLCRSQPTKDFLPGQFPLLQINPFSPKFSDKDAFLQYCRPSEPFPSAKYPSVFSLLGQYKFIIQFYHLQAPTTKFSGKLLLLPFHPLSRCHPPHRHNHSYPPKFSSN